MIIVRIWEGLGNQLFQYAYARCLKERTGKQIYLDKKHCNRGNLPYEIDDNVDRKFQLDNFGITLPYIETCTERELTCLDNKNKKDSIAFLFLYYNFGKWQFVEDEDYFTLYRENMINPDDKTYLNVHCTNKAYYEEIRDILLQEIKPKVKVSYSRRLERILREENTVSLHIRLTDYLKTPSAICKQEYYDKAISYIYEKVEKPYFIIFTDDEELAKSLYHFSGQIYWAVEEKLCDYQELILISQCKHNIMAGSTFSYWGAWLNNNPDKIVIAPDKWLKKPLYEDEWITM